MDNKEFAEWLNEHTTFLWKIYFVDGEGSLEVEDICVVADTLDEAKEKGQIWATGTRTEDNTPIITKIELLEWVCIQ